MRKIRSKTTSISFNDAETYEKYILPKIMIEPNTGCWLWVAALSANGYGSVCFPYEGRWKTRNAHRACFELLRGKVPKEMHLDHLCHTRACCNPDHLEVVTLAENTRRAIPYMRLASPNAKRNHCAAGHEYIEQSTLIVKGRNGNPNRQCKICNRLRYERDRNAA